MNAESPHDICTWESYLKGPRWILGETFIEQGVMSFNAASRKHKLGDIEIVYVRESHSLVTRTLLFKLRGKRRLLEIFQRGIEKSIREAGY